MFGWRVQRSTADPRVTRGSGVATSLGKACNALNMQAEAPWRHSASSSGPASQDAQLEGCSAVRRHVTGESMHCLHLGSEKPPDGSARPIPTGSVCWDGGGSAAWLRSRWPDDVLASHRGLQ
jgi:hypothetical protein